MENVPFYARIVELLASGEEFTIVDLLETRGSVPQEERAKLIVHPDGKTEGTLGGGDLEARVTADALQLELGEVKVMDYDLADLGMVCGGAVKVLYHRLRSTPEEEGFYQAVARRVAAGESVVIAQAVAERGLDLPRLLIAGERVAAEAGDAFPGRNHALDAAMTLLAPDSKEHCAVVLLPKEGAVIYLERLAPLPRLLIFGAGHIGVALARIAHDLGLFQVEVADERDESLRKITRDGVRTCKVAPEFSDGLPAFDRLTYIVIITRSHATDLTVLREVLRRDEEPKYIGVIGSRNKKREVFNRLRADGVPEERLRKVTMPIGLRLGGKAPGEVAVSILAQLIRVKNGVGGDGAL